MKEKLNNGTVNPKTMERDFKKKNAVVCTKITESIEVIDRNNIEIRKTCGEQLQVLRNRYENQRVEVTNEWMSKYFNYKMDDESIEKAFTDIQTLGHRIASRNKAFSGLADKSSVFGHLLEAFFPVYDIARDTLMMQPEKSVKIN